MRERYKSKAQESGLQNIKRLYEAREPVIKLFNDYYTIAPEAKYKTIHEKGRPADLATWTKLLNPKSMLQRIPIALAQVIAGNTSQLSKYNPSSNMFLVWSE